MSTKRVTFAFTLNTHTLQSSSHQDVVRHMHALGPVLGVTALSDTDGLPTWLARSTHPYNAIGCVGPLLSLILFLLALQHAEYSHCVVFLETCCEFPPIFSNACTLFAKFKCTGPSLSGLWRAPGTCTPAWRSCCVNSSTRPTQVPNAGSGSHMQRPRSCSLEGACGCSIYFPPVYTHIQQHTHINQ